jgi:hypothetical protein
MRANATSLMRRRVWKTATPANIWASALEVREFAERLPGRVNRILDALACNDLRLKVEVIDHGSIIEGLQKVANRIALGLVLAALIVGAAMLMRVPTAFTILGYPGLAILLFLIAAGGGFWMAWTILAGDVRRVRSIQIPRPKSQLGRILVVGNGLRRLLSARARRRVRPEGCS